MMPVFRRRGRNQPSAVRGARPACRRPTPRQLATLRLALLPFATLGAACTSDMDAAERAREAAVGAAAGGPLAADGGADAPAAAELTAISPYTGAQFSGVAAHPVGTVHAAWLDRDPQVNALEVYHRVRANYQQAWGPVSRLSVRQTSIVPGIPRVAVDGAGRVYVVWKELHAGITSMLGEDRPGGNDFGTLTYRVLDGDQWSAPMRVGTELGVSSFFLDTDARGHLHLVWSQAPQPASLGSSVADASGVAQGVLDGTALREARYVAQARGTGYWGLSGYVDDAGAARWVAVRESAAGQASLVHWDGARETSLFDHAALHPSAEHGTPQLARDAAGAEHLILKLDDGRTPAQVIDVDPARPGRQVPVFRVADGGRLLDFQVTTGPSGEIVTTIQASMPQGAERTADLLVTSFDGQGWRRPTAVTRNVERRTAAGIATSTARTLGATTVWNTVNASAAVAPSGELHFLTTALGTTTVLDIRPGGWAGAGSTSMLFHGTLPAAQVRGGTGRLARDGASPAGPAPAPRPAPQPSGDGDDAEGRFAQYDATADGWLSGTELDACRCRVWDGNGNGEVTRAEFVAGYIMAQHGVGPAAGGPPAAPAAPAAAPRHTPPARGRADAAAWAAAVPTGKYNCYAYAASRPMPWEPGFGGMAEVPTSTVNYLMNLTVLDGGSYQYLNRGRGTYGYDARTGAIEWRSGPFAGSGVRAALRTRDDGRPVIFLSLQDSRSVCVGPQR